MPTPPPWCRLTQLAPPAVLSSALSSGQSLATTLHYADGTTACDAAFEGGPVALAYGRFDAPTREAVRSEYLHSVQRWAHANGYALPGEFVLGMGTRA